jgi:hypothetical protein
MLKYLLLWFPMLLIAILNGAMRESWLRKRMSTLSAHQLSTLTLIILFGVYMAIIFSYFNLRSGNEALKVGIIWTIMTLLFEFGFGRWRGTPWTELLADYNILQGRLWVLVPIWMCIAPYLFYRFSSQS